MGGPSPGALGPSRPHALSTPFPSPPNRSVLLSAPTHPPSDGAKAPPTLRSYCCWAAGPCVPKRGIPRPAGLWSWWVFCEIGGGGGQELEPVFLSLNLLSTVRPPPLETSMDFQVAKLGARQGGAGRGCWGVRPSSPVGAGGRVWRNVESLPDLTGKEARGATLYGEPTWW